MVDANAIVDELLARFDPEHRVIPATHLLYNEHCLKPEGTQVAIKDLSLLGRDLKNVIFFDDFPASYFLQPRNAIPVNPWDPSVPDNNALYKVLGFCKQIADSPADVRELIAEYKCGRYD